MKRTCELCGRPLLVKNTGREHHEHGRWTYRCKECVEAQVARAVAERRARLGLPAR